MWDPFWTFGPTMIDFGASRQANEASSRANSAEQHVRELEHRVERLALACNAMWSLLRDQTGLTDPQLLEKIQQMDSADEVVNGRVKNLVQCPSCHRQVSPRKGKCIYCGTICTDVSAFGDR
jgi:hypothetical protein